MTYHSTNNYSSSPIYTKAVEILVLSKNISQYLVNDMSVLDEEGKEHVDIYFTGDIVQKSVSMFPEIVSAETKVFIDDKHKHAASLAQLTLSIYNHCKHLEKSVSKGHDFLKLLQNELKRFRKLQHNWMLSF